MAVGANAVHREQGVRHGQGRQTMEAEADEVHPTANIDPGANSRQLFRSIRKIVQSAEDSLKWVLSLTSMLSTIIL